MNIYKNIVILTGAGISAESGLATFRSSNGLWNNHKVEDVATVEGFAKNPAYVHDFYNELKLELAKAKPNNAHLAITKLQKEYPANISVVTQNVDTLHEKAKNKNIAIFWYKKSAEQKYLAAEEALAKYGVYVDNRPKTTQTTSSTNSSQNKSSSHNHSHNDVHINTYQPEYGYRDVWKPCTSCGGSGRCSNCNGTGQKLYGGTHKILSDCPVCHSGRCSICYGQGGHYEKEMYQIR